MCGCLSSIFGLGHSRRPVRKMEESNARTAQRRISLEKHQGGGPSSESSHSAPIPTSQFPADSSPNNRVLVHILQGHEQALLSLRSEVEVDCTTRRRLDSDQRAVDAARFAKLQDALDDAYDDLKVRVRRLAVVAASYSRTRSHTRPTVMEHMSWATRRGRGGASYEERLKRCISAIIVVEDTLRDLAKKAVNEEHERHKQLQREEGRYDAQILDLAHKNSQNLLGLILQLPLVHRDRTTPSYPPRLSLIPGPSTEGLLNAHPSPLILDLAEHDPDLSSREALFRNATSVSLLASLGNWEQIFQNIARFSDDECRRREEEAMKFHKRRLDAMTAHIGEWNRLIDGLKRR